MNTKVVAILAVLVVVGAGVGIAVMTSAPQEKVKKSTNLEGRLMIYGNANGDDYLDKDDLTKINEIIADIKADKPWDAKAFPFADANCDGVIDENDVQMIKDLIDRKPMVVNFADATGTKSINYPIKHVGIISTPLLDPMIILGVQDKVIGRHNSPQTPLDPIKHQYYIKNVPAISKNAASVERDLVSKESQKYEGGMNAILTRVGFLMKEQKALESDGIKILRMGFESEKRSLPAYLTLGYLMEAEKRSHEVVEFIDGVNEKIVSVVSKKTDAERPVLVTVSGHKTDAISGNTDENSLTGIRAGGINRIVVSDSGSGMGGTTKSIKENDTWQLGSEYECKYLINNPTALNYESTKDSAIKSFNEAKVFFNKHETFPKGFVVVSTCMPPCISAAYLSQFFFPEDYEKDFADKIHQDFVDKFLGIKYDVKNGTFLITYDDVKDKLASA